MMTDKYTERAREIWGSMPDVFDNAIAIKTIAQALRQERNDTLEQRDLIRSQAYQVIGVLLDKLDMFETVEGQRALDYFSDDGEPSEEFLPWPK